MLWLLWAVGGQGFAAGLDATGLGQAGVKFLVRSLYLGPRRRGDDDGFANSSVVPVQAAVRRFGTQNREANVVLRGCRRVHLLTGEIGIEHLGFPQAFRIDGKHITVNDDEVRRLAGFQ